MMNENETTTKESYAAKQGTGGDRMRRLVRLCWWAAINGGLAWCAWAGVHGNEGAGRLLAFAAWTFGIIQFVGGMSDDVKSSAAKKGRSIPAWLSHGTGTAMIGFLVWHGWWWTAIAYLLAELGEAAIFHKPNDEMTSPHPNQKQS